MFSISLQIQIVIGMLLGAFSGLFFGEKCISGHGFVVFFFWFLVLRQSKGAKKSSGWHQHAPQFLEVFFRTFSTFFPKFFYLENQHWAACWTFFHGSDNKMWLTFLSSSTFRRFTASARLQELRHTFSACLTRRQKRCNQNCLY